jgi:hypothetical protein
MNTETSVDLKTLTSELGLTRRQLKNRVDQLTKSGLLRPGEDFWREYRGAPLPLEDYDRLKQFSVIKVKRDRILQLLRHNTPPPSTHRVDDPLTYVNQSDNASGNSVNKTVNQGQPTPDPTAPALAALERENELLREIVTETRKEREYYKRKSDDGAQKLEEKNDQIMGWMQQVIKLKDQVLQLTSGKDEQTDTKRTGSVNVRVTEVNPSVNQDEKESSDHALEHASMPEFSHAQEQERAGESKEKVIAGFQGGEHARKLEVRYLDDNTQ